MYVCAVCFSMSYLRHIFTRRIVRTVHIMPGGLTDNPKVPSSYPACDIFTKSRAQVVRYTLKDGGSTRVMH